MVNYLIEFIRYLQYSEIMVEKRIPRFLRYWFPVLFYCLIIFVQSSYPTVKETYDLPHIDKLLHLAGYALLGMLFLRGFRNSRFKNDFPLIRTASILLTAIYGATDELHQHYVPYRTADIWDVFFDLSGGFLGVYIYQKLSEKYPKIGRI
ncbi:MAG: VanZ family protein [Deltaproteobacteria bacterium]|nr:VanZ family protein [Deltaproteobacteria bacterium]MBW1794527.1 VanZ family protein [Deltaproteobacteria bacterium]MBW2331610.1 VanZ family protein [Deltaproteobacteria bacterium]